MAGGLGITGVVREGSISAALDHPGGVKYLRPGCSHGGQILPAPTAVYKNDSNLVESLEKQYLLALETAGQEWKEGSELCHWEMARFLIEKICDPIKETIRQEFDRQYRLEWKRSQLKVNFTDKAKKEIEDLDSELLMKQGLGTMSYKTLKQRLVELSKEFERYCPAGGRKKRK